MKKMFSGLLLLSLMTIATIPLFAQTGAVFQFEDANDTYDFGTVKEGTVVTHDYVFKNVGDVPLQILRVDASCGCTTPDWPKRPIMPGQKGVIKVTFTSEGNSGPAYKEITIQSNAVLKDKNKARYTLVLKGEVLKK